MTREQFVIKIAETAKIVCKERGYGYAQFATCCAQAACESGYGQSKIMSNANAFFGIKATKSWVNAAKYGGKVYNSKTSECYDGKTYTQITACFRAYNSLEDSVRDYFDLIGNKRYKASLSVSTVEECIKIIHESGYATSPTYQSTILNIYKNMKESIDKIWLSEYNITIDVSKYPTIRKTTCSNCYSAWIIKIQTELNRHGAVLTVDGKWGSKTDLAVRQFQDKNGLTVDGIVGQKTWACLMK